MNSYGKTASEIFERIRQAIQAGDIQAGEHLPPVRELAVTLGVNRNTVAAAYKRLVIAGLALTQGRLGTVVRAPEQRGEQEGATRSVLLDLASGNPARNWLPTPRDVLSDINYEPHLYGEWPIDRRLQHYAEGDFQADCPAEFQVDITYGAVDAIERLLAAYVRPGDKVAVEAPCFISSVNILRLTGMKALGVPVDEQGMQVEALRDVLEQGAQVVLLTPRAQNPTGCSLSESRATALRELLAEYPHVLVVVDDHFALLAQTPYYSVLPEGHGHWSVIRSVSKGLGPDWRLALLASSAETSRRLRLRLAPGTQWVSHWLQSAVAAMLDSEEVQTQLVQASRYYRDCRQVWTNALQAKRIPVWVDSEGFNLWLPLEADIEAVTAALADKGWQLRGGQAFAPDGQPCQGLRLTVSTVELAHADPFAEDLAQVLASAR